jgi:dipeptidyl aminopeptidase/acylaminoacyl peptidase
MTDTRNEPDARVAAATAHWSHRFLSNGIHLADFQDVTGSISSWDEWCAAWATKGDVHYGLGLESEASGRLLSAGEHFTAAGVCYHFGKFLFVHDVAQMRAAHARAVDSRNRALPLLDPQGERVAIPWNRDTLYGNLRKPRGIDMPPVVVMIMGLDSTKEEMHTNEATFLARGMATLAFDGPGQGEAEYDHAILPEYEGPVAAVIDYLETRVDIDPARIGIWGVSLGGYYAPRAAAFEKRIRACISLTGPFDFAEAFDRAPELTRAAVIARTKAADAKAARKITERMSLSACAKQITCPIYIVGGKLDRVIPPEHAEQLAVSVSGPVELNMVEDGGHVANNRPYKYRGQSADWMAVQLLTSTR